jgi:hypothetical protein
VTPGPSALLSRALDELTPRDATALIDTAADLVLVVDPGGVVREVRLGVDGPTRELCAGWVGKPWVDIVTRESRDKVQALMTEARAGGVARWRHVNHPLVQGEDLAVMYSPPRGWATKTARWWPSAATCAAWPGCSSAWSTPSMPSSATTGGCAASRPASGCCSTWRRGHRGGRRGSPMAWWFTDPDGPHAVGQPGLHQPGQLSAEEQARGESLDRWLGRTGVDLGVLITNLRQRGSVRLFTTTLRGEFGAVLRGRDLGLAGGPGPTRRRWPLPCATSAAGCKRRRSPCAQAKLPRSVAADRTGGPRADEGHRQRDHRPDRAAVHRNRAAADPGQPRLGRRDAGPVAAEPVRQAAPLRHGRPGAGTTTTITRLTPQGIL